MQTTTVQGWFSGRLPDDWFTEPVEVRIDREEVQVIGRLAEPAVEGDDGEAAEVACRARIQGFRDDTRDHRVVVALEAEARLGRKVSWGVRCGELEVLFTTAGVPVMTRLRMAERRVLDTLIDAGVARSRSEALAWCVRLVGEHQGEWIDQLREALTEVERLRAEGPGSVS